MNEPKFTQKLCKDCKYGPDFGKGEPDADDVTLIRESIARCEHPTVMAQDPVSGRIYSRAKCADHRALTRDCGPEAKLFEPREAQPPELTREGNPPLYEAIAKSYGAADGSKEFTLPPPKSA